ncbi:hypothetical protein [Stigmatella aurantiaca]|uniref:hypothetical protein n=1 Tax=Stigmatella aurantiaca TaxID=41 RepID=UPI0011D201BD|nr:hypothetical protein [Stigmatella aurantiaca]
MPHTWRDRVVDSAGGVHFLEVNQGRQFLFLEEWVDTLPLLKAMCALLAQGRAHCSHGALPRRPSPRSAVVDARGDDLPAPHL